MCVHIYASYVYFFPSPKPYLLTEVQIHRRLNCPYQTSQPTTASVVVLGKAWEDGQRWWCVCPGVLCVIHAYTAVPGRVPWSPTREMVLDLAFSFLLVKSFTCPEKCLGQQGTSSVASQSVKCCSSFDLSEPFLWPYSTQLLPEQVVAVLKL